jgi:hypothetical protein
MKSSLSSLLLLSIALSFAPTVLGEGEGEGSCDGVTDKQKVDLSISKTAVSFRSKSKDGKCKGEIDLDFKADSGLRSEGRVKSSSEDAKAKAMLKVEYSKLLEVTIDDGAIDSVVTSTKLGDIKWDDDLACYCGDDKVTDEDGLDCEDPLECRLTGTLEVGEKKDEAKVGINVTVVPQSSMVSDDYPLNPGSMKMTVDIDEYPFKEDDSFLAIEARVESGSKSLGKQEKPDEEERGSWKVKGLGNVEEDGGIFTWATSFTKGDGTEGSLLDPIGDDDTGSKLVTFVFANEDGSSYQGNVHWDPVLEMAGDALTLTSSLTLALAAVVAQLFA